FNVYEDWNYWAGLVTPVPGQMGVEAYGRRRSLSTFVRAPNAPHPEDSAIGTLSQTFVVPDDARALRFIVCGGARGRVALSDGPSALSGISGKNDNGNKIPVSWDLTAYRGKALRFAVIDNAGASRGGWNFIGISGVDLITSYNGP